MPETRKHTREVRDELDRAILAALGDVVRPLAAGEAYAAASDPAPAGTTPPPPDAARTVLGLPGPGASTFVGGYVWRKGSGEPPGTAGEGVPEG